MMLPLLRLQSLPLICTRPIILSQLITPSQTSMSAAKGTTIAHDRGVSPDDVLKFWFEELSIEDWFKADPVLGDKIRAKFEAVLTSATQCELEDWRADADGALAEIVVLDQFSRNIYRGTSRAFAQDPLALGLAQEAIAKGFDKNIMEAQKLQFLYMPFMHSESSVIHKRAMELFQAPGLELTYDFEKKHKAIIDRFGRYPHRNKILGRESTQEEEDFLLEPDSSF